MSNKTIPRVVVAGLRGGSGKTIVSLSLIALLKNKGLTVSTFKKGPDYIDAGWLAKAAGYPCYNLDLFMMSSDQVLKSFITRSHQSQIISVIEGNRGLYDGMDAEGSYSTAELSKHLKSPVIVAVDCTKTTSTIAAMILGCQKMDPDVVIGGVVLNRVATARQEGVVRKAIDRVCNIPVLGAIPRLKKDPFPERHMGLVPFQERQEIDESIATVSDIGEKYLDFDGIMKVASSAEELKMSIEPCLPAGRSGVKSSALNEKSELKTQHPKLKIGVIRDSAFQFYYQENFEALEQRGAELIEVSPLKDDSLPDIDALYIGGGFPETHAIALAENIKFKQSLYNAVEQGLPVYAECGGLMYLGSNIRLDEKTYPMTGILPITFSLDKKPQAHGYSIVKVERANPFFPVNTELKGHEFHYSRVLDVGDGEVTMAFNVKRGKGIKDKKDGMCYKNTFATYTHLHASGAPEWADGMVRAAEEYKFKNKAQRHKVDTTRYRGTI